VVVLRGEKKKEENRDWHSVIGKERRLNVPDALPSLYDCSLTSKSWRTSRDSKEKDAGNGATGWTSFRRHSSLPTNEERERSDGVL
jgi:hypothetical protein